MFPSHTPKPSALGCFFPCHIVFVLENLQPFFVVTAQMKGFTIVCWWKCNTSRSGRATPGSLQGNGDVIWRISWKFGGETKVRRLSFTWPFQLFWVMKKNWHSKTTCHGELDQKVALFFLELGWWKSSELEDENKNRVFPFKTANHKSSIPKPFRVVNC